MLYLLLHAPETFGFLLLLLVVSHLNALLFDFVFFDQAVLLSFLDLILIIHLLLVPVVQLEVQLLLLLFGQVLCEFHMLRSTVN